MRKKIIFPKTQLDNDYFLNQKIGRTWLRIPKNDEKISDISDLVSDINSAFFRKRIK